MKITGDSITERWRGDGANAWARSGLSRLSIANAGVGGDRTQHVLWRLHNGLLDHTHPLVIFLLIGTNNLAWNSPNEISLGTLCYIGQCILIAS